VRHPWVTVVAISVCAALSGARGFKAVAEWAKDLSRDTLRRWFAALAPSLRTDHPACLAKTRRGRLDVEIGRWLLAQVGWPVRA